MNMIVCSVLVLASVAALGGTDGVKIYRTTGTREFREVVGVLSSAHVQIKLNGLYLPVQVFGNALTTVVIPKTEK